MVQKFTTDSRHAKSTSVSSDVRVAYTVFVPASKNYSFL